jgi:thioredoxin reductase
MQKGLSAFAERARIEVRYGCRWTGTRRDGEEFVLETTDGEYRCRAAIFAIGMAEPWRPDIPGLEAVPHYAEVSEARAYAGRDVFIVGKRTSAVEMADAMLPWARRIFLASPRPATFTVQTHGTTGVRARYVLPYEDALFGGGVFLFNTSIDRVARAGDRWRVHTSLEDHPVFDVDHVLAATGWTTPLGDLPKLGVATFSQGRLIRMTPWWESASVPGLYFAGTVSQGALGLRKHGVGSNSPPVAGFRHNARVLAAHLARTMLGADTRRPIADRSEVVPLLLSEATLSPALWNQQSYLARVVTLDADRGAFDEGIEPLAHFVDAAGPNAVAVVLETDDRGDHHPALYVRRDGHVSEHVLPGHSFHDFRTAEHARALESLLGGLL